MLHCRCCAPVGRVGMTTTVSTCGKCESEVQPDDNFCQECGTALSVPGAADEAVEPVKQAVLTCLNCGAQHERQTRVCGTCGCLMSQMGVYTTAVKTLPQAPLRGIPPRSPRWNVSAGAGSRPVQAGRSQLQSPLLQRVTQAPVNPPASAQPGRAGWERIAAAAAVVLLTGAAGLWRLLSGKQVDVSIPPQAAALKEQSKPVAEQSPGKAGDRTGTSQVVPADRDPGAAAAAVAAEEQAVTKKLAATDNPAVTANRPVTPTTPSAAMPSDAGASRSLADRPEQTPRAAGEAPGERQTATSEPGRTDEIRTEAPAASGGHPAWLTPGTDAASAQAGGSGIESGAAPERTVKFNDADVAKYNRLLAGYFSAARLSGPDSAAGREPPTFKEWIQQGKPNF